MLSLAMRTPGCGLLEAPPEEYEESAWIRRCQNGDRDAFEPLVRRNAGRIHRLVWGMLGERREDADDVVQEIFLKAYVALPKFRGGARFSTWLYRIAVNHCRDHLKRAAPWSAELVEERLAAEVPEDAGGEDEARRARERRAGEELRGLLARLPEKHRRILVMRELEGMSYEEIGETLGIRPGTVRSRLSRARAGVLRAAEKAREEG